jgi:hypothetical protein
LFEEQELAQELVQLQLQALLQGLRVQAQALHWWCQ